ncbi:MAG: hypothetical protein J6Z33_09910 [Lachnospiraceae bacterium]|nr:hypothetical protein [Lachnospiraceae bacterium]
MDKTKADEKKDVALYGKSSKNTLKVHGTNNKQRDQAGSDYIVVVNSKKKKEIGLKKYAVVEMLFKNPEMPGEYRTMITFGKVVVDEDIDDDSVAMDQTIRDALGMEFNSTDGRVKVSPLNRTFSQRLLAGLKPSQTLYMRVNYPSLNDMEKKICRVSADSLKLMNANDGNGLWLQGCGSDFRHDVYRLVDEVVHERNSDWLENTKNHCYAELNATLEKYFIDPKDNSSRFSLEEVEELYLDCDALKGKKDAQYLIALLKCINDLPKDAKYQRKDYIRNLRSIVAYLEWMYDCSYHLVEEKITAHAYHEESERQIKQYQKEHRGAERTDNNCLSLDALYPDSDAIFRMMPDLETIRLDKYYRDLLNLNVLDSIKIRRSWIDRIKDELVDFGIVFLLTILATFTAFGTDNHLVVGIEILISLLVTIALIFLRTL